jgi:hypothetical protein
LASSDIPTYFIGHPAVIAKFYDLVPAPNETYCHLFWPIDTDAADKHVKVRKAADDEARRTRSQREASVVQPIA